MKIVFTKHALRKKEVLEELGWKISLEIIEKTIKTPDLQGKTKTNQKTALLYLDHAHILRIVYEIRSGIIIVITFHISRKGRYGS